MNSRSSLSPQPIDELCVVNHRRPLVRTLGAIADRNLTVGFIGGSITADGEKPWPDSVINWLVQTYPSVAITAENAAIGATGSDSACLRVDREIIDRGCHLTFVEYAVNDFEKESERRGRTREGLVRKLLAAGQDVVLVYTYRQDFYAEMIDGKMPASIAEFETIGVHYGLGSVWVGLHSLNEVRSGRMTMAEWLPDGLHPQTRGAWSYAEAIIAFLKNGLATLAPITEPAHSLTAPLFPLNWQSMKTLPLSAVRTRGPWMIKRVHAINHVEQVLETHTPGATLEFDFVGRGLAMIFDYGKRSAEFRYRIDRGEWTAAVRERPSWAGDRGMVRAFVVADELAPGPHQFEMEVIHGNRPDCTGTECRLAVIGVI
ncbi:SGNH/GDSL hydrolase family protein [soil metagenome]